MLLLNAGPSETDASTKQIKRKKLPDEKMMQKKFLTLLTVIALVAPAFAEAALVTGYAAYTFDKAYAVKSKNLEYSDKTAYSDLPVLMICIDHSTKPPFDMNVGFFTEAGGSAIKGGSGEAGVAAIHWVIDNYFGKYFKNGTGPQQKAFQFALWEIGNDYKGTAASISATAGSVRTSSEAEYDGNQEFIDTYKILYQAMKDNLPGLPTTYRSTTYTLDLFENQDPKYQNMVAIIDRAPPNTVPIAVAKITGTPQVGAEVTGTYTYKDNNSDLENPSGTAYKFVTSPNSSMTNSSDGTVVKSGVTGGADNPAHYTLQPSDLNKYVYFCVTPDAKTGATPGLEACSVAAGSIVNAVSPPQTPTPTPVPTLSAWALGFLAAMLGLMGLRRRA